MPWSEFLPSPASEAVKLASNHRLKVGLRLLFLVLEDMDGDLESEFETHIVDAPRNAEAMMVFFMRHRALRCCLRAAASTSSIAADILEARAAQEAKWAGDYDGRQHWSLREA